MEMLDIYDEYMNYLGCEDRDVIHQKGLWHKTVHCWLYDRQGNVYFQIRKNSQKLYTTASGHVQAGETVKQAFHREVLEEIGVEVNLEDAMLVEINAWRMDKIKNGVLLIDRAFANVYLNVIDEKTNTFKFNEDEVLGLVKVNAKECFNLLCQKVDKIDAVKITTTSENIKVTIDDFLVQQDEVGIIKYGKILQSVIRLVNNGDKL